MYAAKFTVFYAIAALAALVSASPIPTAEPEASLDTVLTKTELLAREPLPEALAVPETEDVEGRICRYGCL
ncbi:hypothetical protein ID866_8188 [Astraeus odoratus]|nr:hypothetical protein ID866_8188 [Astraeus odoratus]